MITPYIQKIEFEYDPYALKDAVVTIYYKDFSSSTTILTAKMIISVESLGPDEIDRKTVTNVMYNIQCAMNLKEGSRTLDFKSYQEGDRSFWRATSWRLNQ